MSTTVYMVLVLPDPSITIGPDWAQELNTALELVDSHDHTPGKGAQITPAGILVNEDLPFGGFNATGLGYAGFASQSSTLGSTIQGVVYRVGNNLYYNNAAGTPVQITSGGVVNAPGSGAISVNVVSSYPYTVVAGDAQKVLIIDTSAARVLNLPAATQAMFFMVKDGPGNALANNISVTPNGGDTIDGLNTAYLINTPYQSLGFVSDGVSSWYVV